MGFLVENFMKNILICEDDAIQRLLLSMILRDKFETTEAENCNDAKRLIQNNNYDIILTDLYLPYCNGFEIIKYVRNNLKKDTPIILITANNDILSLGEALKLGANDYIIKPYDDSIILSRINNNLK